MEKEVKMCFKEKELYRTFMIFGFGCIVGVILEPILRMNNSFGLCIIIGLSVVSLLVINKPELFKQ